MQKLVKEKKDLDLDPKKSNPETKDIITPFQKKSAVDCPPIKEQPKKMKKLNFRIIFSTFKSLVLFLNISWLILGIL